MMLGAGLLFSGGGAAIMLVPWSGLAINGARMFIAAFVTGFYMLLTHHKIVLNRVTVFGAICVVCVTTLFTLANKLTAAGNAIILQYTCPVWIMLLMALFFHAKPGRRDIITMVIVFAGILCFFFDSISAGGLAGDFIAVASGVFYAGVFIINSFPEGDALSSYFMGEILGAVLLGPLVFRETQFSPAIWAGVIFLGAVQVGLAYILLSEGTRYTKPIAASLIAAVEPIMNPIWVAIFWGQSLSPLCFVGAAIVIAAIAVYNILKIRDKE